MNQLPLVADISKYVDEYYHNFDVKNVDWILDYKYPVIVSVAYLIVSYSLKMILGTESSSRTKSTESSEKKNKDGLIMYFFAQWHNINLIVLSFSMLCGIVFEIANRSMVRTTHPIVLKFSNYSFMD